MPDAVPDTCCRTLPPAPPSVTPTPETGWRGSYFMGTPRSPRGRLSNTVLGLKQKDVTIGCGCAASGLRVRWPHLDSPSVGECEQWKTPTAADRPSHRTDRGSFSYVLIQEPEALHLITNVCWEERYKNVLPSDPYSIII